MKRPNILWLMTDEQRTDSLGCYGSPWAHTPNLDGLAREGVVFQNAVTPSPVCVPARCSILAAEHPCTTGVWYNITEKRDLPSLTHAFHDAGYRSATFGKQHYPQREHAFQTEQQLTLSDRVDYFSYAPPARMEDCDVVRYPDEPYGWIFGGRYPGRQEDTAEHQAVTAAKRWLEDLDGQAPFLLRISFNAPHTPVSVPEPFDRIIAEDALPHPWPADGAPDKPPRWIADDLARAARSDRLSEGQLRKARRYYYGQVAFVDHLCGELLDWMRERGLLDNTLVAFVSDHGTHLGDFGLMQKQSFYEPSVTVPYFFWAPGRIAEGARTETPVEVCGLLPTLADLAGVELPERHAAQSLATSLRRGSEPGAQPVFSELTLGSFNMRPDDRLVMVRDRDWKLSLCLDPEPGDGFLANLRDDPLERRNLCGLPEYAESERRLARMVEEHLAQ